MKEDTSKALKKYKEAWESSLNPKSLSIVRQCVALSNGPISFSELLEKTGISSRTLDKWLKQGVSKGLVSKKRESVFPWKTTYALTEDAKPIRTTGKYIRSLDDRYRHLIEGAGEGSAPVEEIVEEAMRHRKKWLDLFFSMDSSWLEGISFEYIKTLFSAIGSITFWGTFFALSFPQVREKAREIMLEKDIFARTSFQRDQY